MRNNLQKNLGLKIKSLRKLAGMSQEKLAEKLEIAINTLSNIERGNAFMTSNTLEKISNIFGISYSELFDFEVERNSAVLYEGILARLELVKENPKVLSYIDAVTKVLIN